MEFVVLRNGVKMPQLGYGVYQVTKAECERCVLDALRTGYRLIDTAQVYGNERGVGEGVRGCGVPREELFAVLLPVNGRGNNMNMADASRFAARTGAKYAVPVHIGMFDTMTNEAFRHPGKITPEIYREIVFPE